MSFSHQKNYERIEDTFSSKMPGNPYPISGGKLRTSLRRVGKPVPKFFDN